MDCYQVKNKIFNLKNLSTAEYSEPGEHDIGVIECHLTFNDGVALTFTGDEAEQVWKLVKSMAMDITPKSPPSPFGLPLEVVA